MNKENKEWQTYQKLELIAESVAAQSGRSISGKSVLVAQLNEVWQLWANRLLEKMNFEQQVQHLEQCLALEGTPIDAGKKSSVWRNLWVFLNQPIFEFAGWATHEPSVKQVSDQGGQVWWYVYDPQTRQSVYLESENEVLIWLEEHLSR